MAYNIIVIFITQYWKHCYLFKKKKKKTCVCAHSALSDFLQPCGMKPAKALMSMEVSRQEYWTGLPLGERKRQAYNTVMGNVIL